MRLATAALRSITVLRNQIAGRPSPALSWASLHVFTRGLRVASFFRVQSMISDTHARSVLFDLDTAIQAVVERLGRDDPETVKLTGIYHNLIRYWAEV